MSGQTIWKWLDEAELKEYTAIIPSVAVGNVAQLASDLLISSLRMVKIASIYSAAQTPVIGLNPYDLSSDQISTSCELYKSIEKKVCILQIRGPLIFKFAKLFLQEVVNKLKSKGVENVVILTSSHAYEKRHIQSSPFRYLCTETCPYKQKILSLDWVQHEQPDTNIVVSGGGFASMLYKICSETSTPVLLLYKYCSEGDNIPDAYDVLNSLSQVLPLFLENQSLLDQLVQPVSWKLLFGRPPPVGIY